LSTIRIKIGELFSQAERIICVFTIDNYLFINNKIIIHRTRKENLIEQIKFSMYKKQKNST